MPIKRTSIKMHIVTLCKIYIVSLLLSFTFIFFFCQIISEFMFFFFFSSRRRHTRSLRDWSQTCALPISIPVPFPVLILFGIGVFLGARLQRPTFAQLRSEERRVGKECRSRWVPYH